MPKAVLLWIDLTVATQEAELPEQCVDRLDTRACTDGWQAGEEIERLNPSGVCFDFDYPDRKRLTHFLNLKHQYPHIPMFIMTLQHSEALATWSYRNGALDYLVKPIPESELKRCLDRILEIDNLKKGSGRSRIPLAPSPLPNDVPVVPQSTEAKLAPAIYYIQQNYNRRIYSGAVARMCDMSASHFSREFKRVFDLTFQDFLLRYRIGEACRQLRNPGTSITDVAYSVGFTDASYFTRVFRRYVGKSPSAYSASVEATENDAVLEDVIASLRSSVKQPAVAAGSAG